jgi:hypothetical protein
MRHVTQSCSTIGRLGLVRGRPSSRTSVLYYSIVVCTRLHVTSTVLEFTRSYVQLWLDSTYVMFSDTKWLFLGYMYLEAR